MKKHILFLCLLLIGFLFSCNETEDDVSNNLETTSKYLNYAIPSYSSIQEFVNNLESISNASESDVTLQMTKEIEKERDFISMRTVYESISLKFDQIQDKQSLDEFVINYNEWISEDDGLFVKPKLSNFNMMSLISPEGLMFIDEVLFYFQNDLQIIVLDGDFGKLKQAKADRVTKEESGVFVIPNWEVTQRNCGTVLQGSSPQMSDRRVKGDWGVNLIANPRRNSIGQITGWDVGYTFNVNVYAQKRGAFGSWVSTSTFISHVSNYAFYTALFGNRSGTDSWMTSTKVKSINFSRLKAGISFFSGASLPNGISNFDITYCLCGAEYEDVDSYFFVCCNEDCSGLGDADIPE